MANQPTDFGIRIPDVFLKGFAGWWKNLLPLTLAAVVTLGVYGPFRYQAQQLFSDERIWTSIGVDLLGLVIAGTLAYPWYFFALKAHRGEAISLTEPFAYPKRFAHQAVASFFFWAGIMLGIRYPVFGIPLLSMFVLVSYAFHGFVVADTPPNKEGMRGGSYALGTSVRLGDKRRFGLFAIACLLAIFNGFGMMFGFSFDNVWAAYAISILGLVITASVTMVAGAFIYDELLVKMPKTSGAKGRNSSKLSKKRKRSKKK